MTAHTTLGGGGMLVSNGNISFITYTGATTVGGAVTVANRMQITAAGDIGIGTATPGYKLEVNGEINCTGIRVLGVPVRAASSVSRFK